MLIKAAEPLTTSDTKTVSEWTRQMATLPQASKLATRILLLTLLFEVRDKNISFQLICLLYISIIFFYKGTEATWCPSGGKEWDS